MQTPKRVPKGTSSYQAAWYLDDVSDSESDFLDEEDAADVDMDDAVPLRPEDGVGFDGIEQTTEAGPSEYPESEMHLDADAEDEAKGLVEYSRRQGTRARRL